MIRALAPAMALVVLTAAPPVRAASDWQQELREFGYLSRYLRSLNLVTRLHLAPRQARKLLSLAIEMESVAPPRPTFGEPLPPDLAPIRADWRALLQTYLAGEPVSSELRRRVRAAQEAERAFVWSTLRQKPIRSRQPCLSCHQPPRQKEHEAKPRERGIEWQRAADAAHLWAVFGGDGSLRVLRLATAASGALTEPQRAMVAGFLGDLLPPPAAPSTLSTGHREALELLTQCRRCPERYWPTTRWEILTRPDRFSSVLSMGMSAPRRQTNWQTLSRVLAEARDLDDEQFERRKPDLAKATAQAFDSSPGEARLKAACHLLFPGMSAVYGALLRRPPGKTGPK